MPWVEPIHPKAMPVILTTDEERDVWMPPVPKITSSHEAWRSRGAWWALAMATPPEEGPVSAAIAK
jgi:hypothetical protein